ncbi:MAG: LacI family DNA-binding transcriptional regulator [Synergistales bacterium]|nr:LacI family DNA-binding transcriptional regulator [Synergistales bacterium]
MSVTMSDVAHLAGVNKATVSRALKGDPRISVATREKVWKAAKTLGYEPDAVARVLSTHTSDLVGVIFNSLSEPWTGVFLAGLERVLLRHRVEMIVKSTSGKDEQSHNVLKALRSRRADGLIWVDPPSSLKIDLPLVSVGRVLENGFSIVLNLGSLCEKLGSLSQSPWSLCFLEKSTFLDSFMKQLTEFPHPVAKRFQILDQGQKASTKSPILYISTLPPNPQDNGYFLHIPFFELGAIAGRVFLNSLQDRGVRPVNVLMTPTVALRP